MGCTPSFIKLCPLVKELLEWPRTDSCVSIRYKFISNFHSACLSPKLTLISPGGAMFQSFDLFRSYLRQCFCSGQCVCIPQSCLIFVYFPNQTIFIFVDDNRVCKKLLAQFVQTRFLPHFCLGLFV